MDLSFNKFIGQKKIISSLQSLLETQKISHAYLFIGPIGIGKKTIARIFSSLILCEEKSTCTSCHSCLACRLFANGTNPDFYIIDSESASISIDEIRQLQKDIFIKPLYSPKKVYLVANADKMTVQAQNCLLKTLESPPDYAVIILTTSNENALLGTILSRVIKYRFKKNTTIEIKQFLSTNFSQNPNYNHDFLSRYSDGIIGKAINLLNDENFSSIRSGTFEIVFKIPNSKYSDIIDMINFYVQNKSMIDIIFYTMTSLYRDVLITYISGNESILINLDIKDIIYLNKNNFTIEKLLCNIDVIENTYKSIKQNSNYELSIEVMLLKLWEENTWLKL